MNNRILVVAYVAHVAFLSLLLHFLEAIQFSVVDSIIYRDTVQY